MTNETNSPADHLPPLTERMYHAARGVSFEVNDGEYTCHVTDEMLDDIWENINTAERVGSRDAGGAAPSADSDGGAIDDPFSQARLMRWGKALQAEGDSLGDALVAYADSWSQDWAEAVAPEAKADRAVFEQWYDAQPDGKLSPWDVWQSAIQHAIKSGHACTFALDNGGNLYRRYKEPQCAPPAPPAPLPGKESLALLQQAYDALDSMGGFGFTQKASKAMHELHAAITSAKEQTK